MKKRNRQFPWCFLCNLLTAWCRWWGHGRIKKPKSWEDNQFVIDNRGKKEYGKNQD